MKLELFNIADEVSELSSTVLSGNDSTLGRPLNDSSPLPNHSLEHHQMDGNFLAEEQPVSSTPLVLRGGRSSRRPSLRRSIFHRPSVSRDDHESIDEGSASFTAPNPIPRKLNDFFDAMASDSD